MRRRLFLRRKPGGRKCGEQTNAKPRPKKFHNVVPLVELAAAHAVRRALFPLVHFAQNPVEMQTARSFRAFSDWRCERTALRHPQARLRPKAAARSFFVRWFRVVPGDRCSESAPLPKHVPSPLASEPSYPIRSIYEMTCYCRIPAPASIRRPLPSQLSTFPCSDTHTASIWPRLPHRPSHFSRDFIEVASRLAENGPRPLPEIANND